MSDYDFIVADELPESLHEMVAAVGFGPVLRLVRKFGGCRLHIPSTVRGPHPITEVAGDGLMEWLRHRWGGDVLHVPRAAAALRAARNRQICQRCDQGESTRRLAMAFSLTERQIWRILGDPRGTAASSAKSRQLTLTFDD